MPVHTIIIIIIIIVVAALLVVLCSCVEIHCQLIPSCSRFNEPKEWAEQWQIINLCEPSADLLISHDAQDVAIG